MKTDQYVVLECVPYLPGYPRYGFATLKHAEELGDGVRWLQTCSSLEEAATLLSEMTSKPL